jgi:hypothetical protein
MRIEYSDVKNDFYTVYAILSALKLSAPPKCRSQEIGPAEKPDQNND